MRHPSTLDVRLLGLLKVWRHDGWRSTVCLPHWQLKCERLDLLDGVEDQSAEADFAAPEK
jgi:hypothetical protein